MKQKITQLESENENEQLRSGLNGFYEHQDMNLKIVEVKIGEII